MAKKGGIIDKEGWLDTQRGKIYIDLFLPNVGKFEKLARDQIQKSYFNGFNKAPVDTLTASKNTKAIVTAQLRPAPSIKIEWFIPDSREMMTSTKKGLVNYALFFIAPLQPRNPNFKYGARDTVGKSREFFMKAINL